MGHAPLDRVASNLRLNARGLFKISVRMLPDIQLRAVLILCVADSWDTVKSCCPQDSVFMQKDGGGMLSIIF